MAYDVELADRIRDELRGEPGLTEKAMFGGLASLVGGHMAAAASSGGGMLLRCGAGWPSVRRTRARCLRSSGRRRDRTRVAHVPWST